MATINDIKAYIRETPYNTNPNVLDSLLDSLETGGGSGGQSLLKGDYNFTTVSNIAIGVELADFDIASITIPDGVVINFDNNDYVMSYDASDNNWSYQSDDLGIMFGIDEYTNNPMLLIQTEDYEPGKYHLEIKEVERSERTVIATILEGETSGEYNCDKTYEELWATLTMGKDVYFDAYVTGFTSSNSLVKGSQYSDYIKVILLQNKELHLFSNDTIEITGGK